MFQLLITVNLKSGVGAGVAISTTVASFTSEKAAETALNLLGSYTSGNSRHSTNPFTERKVERLYQRTK